MSTRWARSADKHGIDRADALHAMRSAYLIVRRFDRPRAVGAPYADLFVGPGRDGRTVIEVFAHLDEEARDVLIFHVMPVRRSTLERARRVLEDRREPG